MQKFRFCPLSLAPPFPLPLSSPAPLLMCAVLFNRDTNRLVLRPIERMLKLVKDVSENPLASQASQAASEPPANPSHALPTPLFHHPSLFRLAPLLQQCCTLPCAQHSPALGHENLQWVLKTFTCLRFVQYAIRLCDVPESCCA